READVSSGPHSIDGKPGLVPRSPILRPLGGTSLAIAIRGGGCEGARGRDRTLRLPVIRLRPRTFACARTASFEPGASSARSVARFDNTLRLPIPFPVASAARTAAIF